MFHELSRTFRKKASEWVLIIIHHKHVLLSPFRYRPIMIISAHFLSTNIVGFWPNFRSVINIFLSHRIETSRYHSRIARTLFYNWTLKIWSNTHWMRRMNLFISFLFRQKKYSRALQPVGFERRLASDVMCWTAFVICRSKCDIFCVGKFRLQNAERRIVENQEEL